MSKKKSISSLHKSLVCISEINGENVPAISTINIAKLYSKQHYNVLSKTENYIKNDRLSPLNFKVAEYKDEQGKMRKMYILDERAFHFVVTGFTGEKAEDHRMVIIDEFMKLRKQINKASKVMRMPFDYPAEMNQMLNETLLKERTLQGKETTKKHYMAMAMNINTFAFGKAGKGQELRKDMDQKEYQSLISTFRKVHNSILKGNLHKNEIENHLDLKEGNVQQISS